ncbi:MAG: TerC family protein [Roseiflexaceae bacterium]
MVSLFSASSMVTLFTLTFLEIVLGVDNVIFIAILAGKLPADQQQRARQFGLVLALVTRILLLFSLTWIMQLVKPLFAVWEHEISGRDLILLAGGLFLLAKSTIEMHHSLEGHHADAGTTRKLASFWSTVVQIGLLDIVFSLDSVITAVGLSNNLSIMITAIVIAMIIMLAFAETLSRFIDQHPTLKILALSFLTLIGMSLVAEGLDFHIEKGYIYFAMGFSVLVELINMRMRASAPVRLHKSIEEDTLHS